MKITYIHHSAFLVETESAYLLFDYTEGTLPELLPDKPLVIFVSHRHGDHYDPVIFAIGRQHGHVLYVLSYDIWRKRLPEDVLPVTDSVKHGVVREYRLQNGSFVVRGTETAEENSGEMKAAGECVTKEKESADPGTSMKVTTYRSTDEGVAFLVEIDGKVLYHAGDLNNWTWEEEPKNWNESMAKKYTAQVDKMAGLHVDAAFLPLDPRQGENFYLGMDEFMRKVDVERAFPVHCWGDFSVIGRIKAMECSVGYRDRIADIRKDGDVFL